MERQTVKIINIKQASLYIKNGLQPKRVYFDIKDACNDKSKPFGIIWKKAGKNGEQSRGTVAVIDIDYFYKLLTKK